jgi:protein-tyrosine sulfotransferase
MNDKPIFILGAHKSGTSLLRSLLDGHPDLFVIPFESHFFENYNYWITNPYRSKRPRILDISGLEDSFVEAIAKYRSKDNKYGDIVLGDIINLDRFRRKFRLKKPEDLKMVYEKYMKAIYYSLHGKCLPDQLRVAEKSVENYELVPEFHSLYPKAKFIHILRNPYANIVSLRKFRMKSGNGYPILSKASLAIHNSFYYAFKNSSIYENYLIVKYEDLVSGQDQQLKGIAEFLNIENISLLTTPTVMGEVWKGNSTRDTTFKGISKSSIQIWKKEITRLEIGFINSYLKDVLTLFGYQALSTIQGKRSIPAPNSIPRFLFNLVDLHIRKRIR